MFLGPAGPDGMGGSGRWARWVRWFHWAWCLEGGVGLGPPGGQQQAGGTRRRPAPQGVGPTSWAVGAAGPLPMPFSGSTHQA